MHPLRWLAAGLFALGVVLLAFALARHEAVLFLVLIFPVIQATGPLAIGAIAALFGGILLFFAALAVGPAEVPRGLPPVSSAPPNDYPPGEQPSSRTRGSGGAFVGPFRPRTRAGGVVFLGPFPIVFGSDAQVARWMIVVAVVLFALLLAFWLAIALL